MGVTTVYVPQMEFQFQRGNMSCGKTSLAVQAGWQTSEYFTLVFSYHSNDIAFHICGVAFLDNPSLEIEKRGL
jgi:hypothetical protein